MKTLKPDTDSFPFTEGLLLYITDTFSHIGHAIVLLIRQLPDDVHHILIRTVFLGLTFNVRSACRKIHTLEMMGYVSRRLTSYTSCHIASPHPFLIYQHDGYSYAFKPFLFVVLASLASTRGMEENGL